MRAEIAGDQVALPVGGELLAADDFEAAQFRITAGTDAAENVPGLGRGRVARARQTEVDAKITRAVGDERLAEVIELVSPRIDPAFEKNFQLLIARIEAEHAAAFQTHHAVRRLGVGARVDGLIHVEAAVEAPAQRVQIVMRVLRAEAAQHRALHIRFAVAARVCKVQQLRALRDVTAAVARLDARGNQQAFREHRGLVRAARAGGVFEHDDFVGGGLAGFDLRIHFRTRDPEPALRIEVHLDGFFEQRILGPERDFESVGDRETWQRLVGVLGGEVAGAQRNFRNADAGFERTELRDAFLLGLDQRIELGNLDGVIALLAFPKAEDVGHVLRARTVKEPFVLAEDGLAEGFGFVLQPLERGVIRTEAKLVLNFYRHGFVAL